MSGISRKHISVGAQKIYVQILGSGPAIALLHPSPYSSDMLLPLAQRLAQNYTVLCIDTAGYGKSDGFKNIPTTIAPYAKILHQLFEKIGISKLALYGSATGAQIAIRYALEHEDTISHLFLDNAAHFDDDLRNNILEHYFPNLNPDKEGKHLLRLWDIVSNMFNYFPWCFKTPEYALNRPQMLKEALHTIAMDYLKAGKSYAYAYRTAFTHERAIHVQQLKVNSSIFRWEGSIILPYIDRLLSHRFPKNIAVINLDKDPVERMDIMAEQIIAAHVGMPNYEFPDTLGEEFVEHDNKGPAVTLPEITEDGTYLLKAWNLIYEHHKMATPNTIQKLLINGYAAQKKK